MFTMLLVVLVVSGALIVGAAWGVFGPLHERTEGFLVALAGGALLLSVVTELIEPSMEKSSLIVTIAGVLAGAGAFTAADYWIDEKWGPESGGGLLAAITLDGVPENLALGVALIGAGSNEVAALAGSILLSNLPEAAGGARRMVDAGGSKWKVIGLWAATAGLLAVAAIAGNLLLEGVSEHLLAFIRCLAAGAVVASLATEVFPGAYKQDRHMAGLATAAGLLFALALGTLAGSAG
jgi:ZIP family zinc transporter